MNISTYKMGSSQSSTNISNSYTFTGDNNGITAGDQSVSGTTASTSTDVSPSTDLNYSDNINPNIGSVLSFITNGGYSKVIGNVKATTPVIEAVKHAAGAVKRIAMGNSTLVEESDKLINSIISTNALGTINGNQNVDIKDIVSLSNLNKLIVEGMEPAHEAYGTLALGTTGARNTEVGTSVTPLSLQACYYRSSETEKLNKDEIIKSVGPRLGVLPKSGNVDIPTVVKETLDNQISVHGKVKEIKNIGKEVSAIQDDMTMSLLHADSNLLKMNDSLLTTNWDSDLIIGEINQTSVLIPLQAKVGEKNQVINEIYPGGIRMDLSNPVQLESAVKFNGDSGEEITITQICLTPYLYDLANDTDFRDLYIKISGEVLVHDQPYDPKNKYYLGFLYNNGNYQFQPAHFINTNKGSAPKDAVHNLSFHKELMTHKQLIYDKAEKKSIADAADYFSITTQYQIMNNLSKMNQINFSDFMPFFKGSKMIGRVLLCVAVIRPTDLGSIWMSVSTYTPTLRFETVSRPTHMLYIGSKYNGSIVDLLGEVPSWYTTGDNHDPVYLYKLFCTSVVKYLGRIAEYHINNEGAALNLSIQHIQVARISSNLPILDDDDTKNHIRDIIIGTPYLLYRNAPLAQYKKEDRIILFNHLIGKVVIQLLTHVKVWSKGNVGIVSNYINLLKPLNARETEMDKAVIKANSSPRPC